MAVKVLIKRTMPEGFSDPMFGNLVRQLRALAGVQSGYISGETLRRVDQPQEYLVIGTWQNVEAWNTWRVSRVRLEIQNQIDALLGTPTQYEVYEHV